METKKKVDARVQSLQLVNFNLFKSNLFDNKNRKKNST